MVETDIGQTSHTDLTNEMEDYEVDTATLDKPVGHELEYTCSKWKNWLGYYKNIPELRAVIDAKATWTIGKGYQADEMTELVLLRIKGWGRDTFNTILENMIRTMQIAGDAFAEIIRDENDVIINLKPLNPSNIKIIADKKGIIKRYEQLTPQKKFQPEEIFHLARNRIADEIHGQSLVEHLEPIILMRNEAMSDWKKVLHRNVAPLWIFHLDTDDPTKISTFKSQMEDTRKDGENMFVPKGAVVPELVSTATNSTLSPLQWIDTLNNYFYQAAGVPGIIVGNSKSLTEASAKMEYLVFQQSVEEEQLYIEENVLNQLNIEINLEFPASLENELLSDKAKDKESGAIEPNDMIAETEGRR